MATIQGTIRSQLTRDPQLPRTNPTTSLWQVPENAQVGKMQSAQLPQQADFVVIGSGVAACGMVRGLLSNPAAAGKTVAVLEARGLCSGATGRNGGQLTRLPPTRHTYIAEQFGVDEANKVVRLTVKGLEEMHKLAAAQGPAFEEAVHIRRLEKFFAYYDAQAWAETVDALKLLEEQVPEERGVYKMVSSEECSRVYHLNGCAGGLRLPAGVCSPYKLVTGTFAALLERYRGRLSIDAHTPATAVSHLPRGGDDDAFPYLVDTPRGSLRAGQVIHCTNGFTGHLVPGLRGKMYPRRGTMSVQAPGPKFPRDMSTKQSWSFYFSPKHIEQTDEIETGRYYGFQHHATGDLWIGGDRDAIDGFITADDSTIDRHGERNIRGALPKLFGPGWVDQAKGGDVRRVWSGIMCYTGDQLPLIGRLPASATGRTGAGEWIVGGWNTYGMTNGLICGDAASRLVLGQAPGDWFPESYLLTEERLAGAKFAEDAVMGDFFERIGAQQMARAML